MLLSNVFEQNTVVKETQSSLAFLNQCKITARLYVSRYNVHLMYQDRIRQNKHYSFCTYTDQKIKKKRYNLY